MVAEREHVRTQGSALLLAVALTSAFFFLATAPHGLSYEYYSKYSNNSLGEIVSISTSPAIPKVLDDTVVTVNVHNLKDYANDYTLRIFVSKDGRVVEQDDITFNLNTERNMSMSVEFVPIEIGRYTVVAKMFNKDTTELYSEKATDVEVVSDIGPFDVRLDVLSRTIRPGYDIPLLLYMKNMGTSGTDVNVSIKMDCTSQGRIYKDFAVYLKGNGELQKSVSMPVCNEKGYHDVSAKIAMFGGVLAQSTSSVLINDTQRPIYVRWPTLIEIQKGTSKLFDMRVRDDDTGPMSNLRAVINGLPEEWLSIDPALVATIKPNESALFIVNVSVPSSAASDEYPFTISVGGDEALVQKDSALKVIDASVSALDVAGPNAAPSIDTQLLEIVAVAAAAAVAAVAIWKLGKSQRSDSKRIILMKMKDIIKANK